MNSKRDYYDVLELPRSATAEDVKKAFRKLALQYHPDRNKTQGSVERFKEVNEAYQVLSDPERRAAYDRFGHAGVNAGAGQGFQGFEGFGGFGDIFDAFFGGATQRGPRRGRDLEFRTTITFNEAAFGATKNLTINRIETCDRCSGTRAEPGSETDRCPTCRGSGEVRRAQRTVFGQFAQVTMCSTCHGEGRTVRVPCKECRARGAVQRERTVSVDIPAGIESGSRIRIRGEGEPGDRRAGPGDLYVAVSVSGHEVFKRDGYDVLVDLGVNIAEAALGATIEVPTLEGVHKLKVPAGTQSGSTFTIKGAGVPHLGSPSRRGDELVTLHVVTPRKLSERQRELLRELETTLSPNGASGDGKDSGKSGWFGRIKDALSGED